MIKAIVGANWGDEGKTKSQTCWLRNRTSSSDSRAEDNAGHTIKNDYGKFALHMLPFRRILRPHYQHHRKRCSPEHP